MKFDLIRFFIRIATKRQVTRMKGCTCPVLAVMDETCSFVQRADPETQCPF